MIPVYLNIPGMREPADRIYYLVAANGIFLVNRTALFTSITQAREIAWLARQEPHLQLAFPRVPRQLMERIYGFFQAVYRRWEGEAVAFLYYARATGHFEVGVPPQEIRRYQFRGRWFTAPKVTYGYLSPLPGYLRLGDAHSHGAVPPFFSATDSWDDRQDGLRIVLGNLDQSRPEAKVSFVAQGVRFRLRPEDVLEEFSSPAPPSRAWLDRVRCRDIRDGDRPSGYLRPLPRHPSNGQDGAG